MNVREEIAKQIGLLVITNIELAAQVKELEAKVAVPSQQPATEGNT